jgi:hypothetical protein
LLIIAVALSAAGVFAQETPTAAGDDKETVAALVQRVNELEIKVAQLEALVAKQAGLAPRPNPVAPPLVAMPTQAQPSTQLEPEAELSERMDLSKTLLRIRGFGDVTLHGDTYPHDTTSFSLGQLNLFVTSDISDKFKFLSEIVFEPGPDVIYGVSGGSPNAFGVDIERLLLQYSANDYFNLAVGRYHTAIGYYNTAYHHSTWFQTTENRPLLFEFEDRGGILPVHNIGVSASGLIPSGSLGLHYVAEVGNGRRSRSPFSEEQVQNTVDENNHKAVNFEVFARPDAIEGLQTGFSVYRDVLTPANFVPVGETILNAHFVFARPKFEWLNEGIVVRHAPQGLNHVFNTPAFYTQISRQWGSYRPYFRYQYINAPGREPIFPDVALRAGPSVGLRYDASQYVALKLQYDYTALRRQAGINSLGLQVGFTF